MPIRGILRSKCFGGLEADVAFVGRAATSFRHYDNRNQRAAATPGDDFSNNCFIARFRIGQTHHRCVL